MSSTAQPVPPSVRLALPSEARQIAEIQRRHWLADPLTRRAAESLDVDAAAQSWSDAIARPPMAAFRVLVAVEGEGGVGPHGQHVVVRGFAALGPSPDPDLGPTDAEVAEFVVVPWGEGHEDRLLHAVADTARADHHDRLTWWLRTTDDSLRAWLTESGWAPDGAHREIGTEDGVVRIRQIRLHTDIT